MADTERAPYPDWAQDLGHGIHAVDTGFQRPRFDAAYLLVHDGRAAIIDSGTNATVPRLLGLLETLGLGPGAVDYVIPTHVHLDHAGGVGALMQALPGATLIVHPRGARHMIDPSQLYAGALAVYGQTEMDRAYGTLVPVPAERVHATHDGEVIALAGRPLVVADTPGHARHHHCLWDEVSGGWFTGDTFGLSYREFDTARGPWIFPTCTPVQFEPDAMRRSIETMLARAPAAMYLTHYSRVADVPRLGALLLALLGETVRLARAAPPGDGRHAALKDALTALYLASLAEHGCTLDRDAVTELLAVDIELNAQGLAVWLDREARSARGV